MAQQDPKQEKTDTLFARPDRIFDAVQLVGHALAAPLVALRGNQARLEAIRTELRLGADHEETQARAAQAEAMDTLGGRIGEEIARQRLHKPDIGDGAGLYGRVTRDGAAVPGVAVSALDENGQTIVHSCTGRDGGYLLSFPPEQPVAIEIRDDSKRLFRDSEGFRYPSYSALHRDIELSGGKPVCPGDKPAEPGGKVGVPSLVGLEEPKAVAELTKLGLKPGKRSQREGAKAGIVVEQHPEAGTAVAPDTAVDLAVSAEIKKPPARAPAKPITASGRGKVSGT